MSANHHGHPPLQTVYVMKRNIEIAAFIAIAARQLNANGRNAISQPMYCTPNPGASASAVMNMISVACKAESVVFGLFLKTSARTATTAAYSNQLPNDCQ